MISAAAMLCRLAALAFLISATTWAAELFTLTSPNGAVRFTLSRGPGDRLSYEVSLRGKPLVARSPLGIVVDGANLAAGVEPGKADRYRTNERYAWHGAWSSAVDRSNGVRIELRHRDSRSLWTLDARAWDDGIAFRCIVPGAENQTRVPDEATAFRLPAGSTVWYHDFEGHYEGVHAKKRVDEVASGDWAATPLTFKLPGGTGYGAIAEGGLRRYAGMGLQADGQSGFAARLGHAVPPSYPFRLRYKGEEERMAKPASITGTITTPWRIVMAAADLNTLVNCGIVNHVAPPPDPKLFPNGAKTEWIRPGRAVWKYLDGGGENNLTTAKEFSKLAADLGFEYQVVEGFWQRWPESDLQDLVAYSRKLGVGIILWKHSRDVREPGKRREFFDMCRRNGVAGAKIDFFDHEAKEVVELYEACLRDAAEFKQILNFHGANKPAGEARTWPDELTREAIRGMEGRRNPRAQHDATLPFTRMLAGHADYTPMVFGERRNDTTWAHQIASAAIFTSPLLVYGANPMSILENPAVDVIRAIPSVWDETVALAASEIGEVAAFARRRGNDWFIAVMNGTTARTIDVPLRFLGRGHYAAALVRDAAGKPDAVRIENATVDATSSLKIMLEPGGGFVARLTPAVRR